MVTVGAGLQPGCLADRLQTMLSTMQGAFFSPLSPLSLPSLSPLSPLSLPSLSPLSLLSLPSLPSPSLLPSPSEGAGGNALFFTLFAVGDGYPVGWARTIYLNVYTVYIRYF